MGTARDHVQFNPLDKASGESADSASPNSGRRAVESPSAEPERQIPPPEPFDRRLAAVCAARNPLLEAARVLLRAQADMPDELASKQTIALLHGLLEQEIRTFQSLCERANIRRDHMIGARYCLCTALDEAAAQTEWGGSGTAGADWLTHSLATTFHEDRKGGEKVYLLIGRLLEDPREHHDLLVVIYRILSLGFEGRYRHETNGPRKHDAIRQRLYNEITAHRGPAPLTLSPHWQSDVKGKRPSFFDFPVWITVAVLSIILLGLFGWFKYELLNRTAELQKHIASIGRMTPASLAAPAPAPAPAPVPTAATLHLKQLLKSEIAAGTLSVDENGRHSAVTFRGDAMFKPGGASVKPSMGPLISKIAAEIGRVPGAVTVVGYTDNVPIRGREFASNQALSEERAIQVMQMLQAAGVPANRLTAIGKGDAEPIADNRSARGRTRNRRVQIVVAQ